MFRVQLRNSVATLALVTTVAGSAIADDAIETSLTPLTDVSTALSPLDPSYGSLDAFWGNLDAFYGNLDAFYGNLDPFYGPLDAFYGNLDPFWGNLDAFYGSLDPFYGSLDAFWGNLEAFYGSLDAFQGDLDAYYGNLDAFSDADIEKGLGALFDQAESVFGGAVESQTGMSFNAAVIAPLLDKYGVDGNDFSGATDLTRSQYTMFLIEFHDALMSYTGVDHVDHWMGSVKWSPRIAQQANSGLRVRVGVLDTHANNPHELIDNAYRRAGGYHVENQNHGAAVASIIAAAHDGAGVMGVAPKAKVAFYNPFDETNTASWDDVRAGIIKLGKRSNVINMSLGVSGWTLHQDWTDVFGDRKVRRRAKNAIFVKAAGNDGLAQTDDVEWGDLDVHDRLLIVGSVDPSNTISTFSNRPGDACLVVEGVCDGQNLLRNRFLVAPGELILVSDNAGGVTRMSGTSFAAPMVTGAVALLQSRWRWLRRHPAETADIILYSATDLGAPGVDSVYGWGLLNIEAALAPLNLDALYIETQGGRVKVSDTGLTLRALKMLKPDESVTAFEYVGGTHRDFKVAVSSLVAALTDQADSPQTASENYLAQRIAAAAANNPGKASSKKRKNKKNKKKKKRKNRRGVAFTDGLDYGAVEMGDADSAWAATFTATLRDPNDVTAVDAVPFQMGAVMTNQKNGLTLQFGEGQGALSFSNGSQFSLLSDYDRDTGGVNPFLGLASGGFYAGAGIPLSESLSFSVGLTQDKDAHQYVDPVSGEMRNIFTDIDAYSASAVVLDFNYALNETIDLTAGYTQLHETAGLLGGQGTGALSLDGGAYTDAVTFGANADLPFNVSVSASATAGKTRTVGFDDSALAVDDGGIVSTAYQVAISKHSLFGENDSMRLSVAQPMHFESGALAVTEMQVVDRETGELAFVTDTLDVHTSDRRYISELLYATPVLEGRAFVSAFGQVELNNRDLGAPQTAFAGGGRFEFRF